MSAIKESCAHSHPHLLCLSDSLFFGSFGPKFDLEGWTFGHTLSQKGRGWVVVWTFDQNNNQPSFRPRLWAFGGPKFWACGQPPKKGWLVLRLWPDNPSSGPNRGLLATSTAVWVTSGQQKLFWPKTRGLLAPHCDNKKLSCVWPLAHRNFL